MMFLKDITKVDILKPGMPGIFLPTIQVEGCRLDNNRQFFMNLIKQDDVWQKHSGHYKNVKRTLEEMMDEIRLMKKPDWDLEWDKLGEEVLAHPKVRLHTLF